MQISQSIHILKHDFSVPIAPNKTLDRFVFSVIIFGDKITLIDSGVKGCHERIFNYVLSQGRRLDEISLLILSHSHPDHIGSSSQIKAATGCRVFAHVGEQNWIEQIEVQNNERPVPGFFNLIDSSIKIDGFLEHGQILNLGNKLSLKCFHTPGHSKGSLSLLFPEEKVLFVGDCIPVEMDIPNYDNYKDVIESLSFLNKIENIGVMLSSWTEPIFDEITMKEYIKRGEEYLLKVNAVVNKYYSNEKSGMDSCRNVITELGLPPAFLMPMVHRAFLSHVK
jgi:hydroxyacylglutathione hydrolase